jgi:sugar fermentation stimulation protein A
METVRLFHGDLEGTFLSRPNRFLVRVEAEGRTIDAHCANPGRLLELLVPGRRVILEHSPGADRKTEWTLAAVYFHGKVISLISVRANRAAEALVLPALFPDAERIRAEYTEGESRFDFLVDHRGRRNYVEVKNCTLSAEGRSMFPDAPTERGSRHLRHLQQLSRDGTGGSVLFLLSHPDALLFSPNIHTDPAFAVTLADTAADIGIRAAAISCRPDGRCTLANSRVEVDLAPAEHARSDRGSYLILLRLDEERLVRVGSLGQRSFPAGWYLYAGSAQRGLTARTARHLRRNRKKKHWHLDYLADIAGELRAFPIRTGEDIECELARRFSDLADDVVTGFGCSDCSCPSHLAFFRTNPLHRQEFFDALLHFRHGRV